MLDIQWLENDVFFVTYVSPADLTGLAEAHVYALNRTKTSITYTKFPDDASAAFGSWDNREGRRFCGNLKAW